MSVLAIIGLTVAFWLMFEGVFWLVTRNSSVKPSVANDLLEREQAEHERFVRALKKLEGGA